MKKNILYLLLSISLIATLMVSCNKNIDTNTSKQLQTEETEVSTNDVAEDISDYNKHSSISNLGLGINLLDENNKGFSVGHINVQTSKDLKLIVDTSYNVNPEPQQEIDYSITAYIDYKQVDFSVEGNPTKLKKYISKAKNHVSNKLTLILPTSSLSGSHKLTIISQNIKYLGEGFIDSICKTFDLNIGSETTYKTNDKKTTAKSITYPGGIDQRMVIINRNFIAENEKSDGIRRSSKVIKSKKGKEISLAIRVPQASNDGIFFLTLNSEQIDIDKDQYLYFSDMKNPMFKKITIKTPDTPGEYYLTGYFVHAPWEKTSDLTAISSSIKLIVE